MEFSIYFIFSSVTTTKKINKQKYTPHRTETKKRKTPQIEIILTKIGYIMDNNTFLYKDYTNEASNFAPLKFPLTLT